jgi:Trypsin
MVGRPFNDSTRRWGQLRCSLALLLACGCSSESTDVQGCAALPLVGGSPSAEFVLMSQSQASAIVLVQAAMSRCTGTLYLPNAVVTAAHCLFESAEVSVKAAGRSYRVSATRIHPTKDLAVLVLEQAVPGADAAPLAVAGEVDVETLTEKRVQIGGYGDTHLADQDGLNFAVATVTRLTDYGFETMTANGGACRGDSGGPALIRASDGSVRLAGVLSVGHRACVGMDIYLRIDAELSWLGVSAGASVDDTVDCGGITSVGRCFDGTAVWCDGMRMLQATSCRSPTFCGWSGDERGFRCVERDPCGGKGDLGTCSGSTVEYCAEGRLLSHECYGCGVGCGVAPTTGRAACVPTQP